MFLCGSVAKLFFAAKRSNTAGVCRLLGVVGCDLGVVGPLA